MASNDERFLQQTTKEMKSDGRYGDFKRKKIKLNVNVVA